MAFKRLHFNQTIDKIELISKSYTNLDVVDFGFSTYDRPANDRGKGVRWKIVTSETTFYELES